jgi:radical SAM protein with 4Fe4S-binding SPASM domain
MQMKEGYAESIWKTALDKEKLTETDPVCSICRYSFCVTASGKVFPCAGWQSNVVGDLNFETVQQVWENSEQIQALRKIKWAQFAQCVRCKDRGYCTVCMMWNSNENIDGNPYRINDYRCRIAALTHSKVDAALTTKDSGE